MLEKLKAMLVLQDETNQRLHPEWKTQGWDFLLAARMEAAEAIDHLGYKWWAPREPDYDQVRMEVVDIWHFLLSEVAILEPKEQEVALREFVEVYDYLLGDGWWRWDYPGRCDVFTQLMTDKSIGQFLESTAKAMQLLDLPFEQVYKLYVGKAALNRFRWANDYGTYRKMWLGREDNEHLTEILSQMTDDEVSVDEVVKRLDARYQVCMPEHYEQVFGGK